jgi:hypothetical protein
MTATDTIKPYIWGLPPGFDAHYVEPKKFEIVRQSDTMSIAFNDEWKQYEPKGQTDLTALRIYQQEQVVKYPLNTHFKECSFVCATICIAFYIIRITRIVMP